jgi:hypothetical protein
MRGWTSQRASRAQVGRLRAADVLTLAAVALVVLLVSLPRLRDLALRENESDALWLTQQLAELAGEREPQSVQALLEGAPDLRRQIDDAEYLEGGRLLRRHGYAFEVLARSGTEGGAPAVRAWPWHAGRTGATAFVWTASRGLVGNANREGRFSGERAPPPETDGAAGWHPVRAR